MASKKNKSKFLMQHLFAITLCSLLTLACQAPTSQPTTEQPISNSDSVEEMLDAMDMLEWQLEQEHTVLVDLYPNFCQRCETMVWSETENDESINRCYNCWDWRDA